MRIGLIASPFLPIPPSGYGGTELVIAQLAQGLDARGVETIVYTVGNSTLPTPMRFLYERAEWPGDGMILGSLKDINHGAWAVHEAAQECDVIHLNSVPALANTRYVDTLVVYTVHHAKDEACSDFYRYYPHVQFVCISGFQRRDQGLVNATVIHHGVDMSLYTPLSEKEDYLCFLGRIAPVKGVDLAIETAKRAGIPLKIAGQIQSMFQEYYETKVKPEIDGRFIEYVGEADLAAKNELLGHSRAMLFPIQWHEPFGLVMIEAMACGTPVLALPGGSVDEVVKEGVSGHVCSSIADLAKCAKDVNMPAEGIRRYAEENFSQERMVDEYIKLYKMLLQRGAKAEKTVA